MLFIGDGMCVNENDRRRLESIYFSPKQKAGKHQFIIYLFNLKKKKKSNSLVVPSPKQECKTCCVLLNPFNITAGS